MSRLPTAHLPTAHLPTAHLPTAHLPTLPYALTNPGKDRLNEVSSGASTGATQGLAAGGVAALGLRQLNRAVGRGASRGAKGGRLGMLLALMGSAGTALGAAKGWRQADANYAKGLQNVRAVAPRERAAEDRAMTPQAQFKLGFLARCAEEGLSAVDIAARVKAADWLDAFSNLPGKAYKAAASAYNTGSDAAKFVREAPAARTAQPKLPTQSVASPNADAFSKSGASLANMATGLATGAGNFILKAPAVAALGAVGGAGILGAGAGYLHRKSELAKPVDTEDIQKQELILAYMQHRQKILNDMKRNNGGKRNMQLEEGF